MNVRHLSHFTPSEVQRAWESLSKVPQEVRVVTFGDRVAIRIGESSSDAGLVGCFDMGIALDDFADELESAARDLQRN